MSEKSVTLYCKEGASDKVYQVHLRSRDGAWVVDFANGRRGGALRTGTKTESPVSLELAQKKFDALVLEKKKGGYTEAESGQAYTSSEFAGRTSGMAFQNPTPIDDDNLEQLLADPRWGTQEKANGERRGLIFANGVLKGTNRRGLFVDLPQSWGDELQSALGQGSFTLDGEHVGDRFWAFDLLEIDGKDVRSFSFEQRYALLKEFVDERGTAFIELLECNFTESQKRSHLEWVKNIRREGVVFKRLDAAYVPGKNDVAMKYKLVESSTCIVVARNAQRSVQIGMRDGVDGPMVPVGNVTIPANHEIPAVGALVEVEYLYYNPGGALEQPVFLGLRTDLTEEAAVTAQITRTKPGVDGEAHADSLRQRERA
jgi:bifunctional non-homologous end joining protein LigD